jgi:spore coat polysaccharide biosynthesis protein SpsF
LLQGTVIIQARMGSSRLPGKVLLKINKKPMLHYVLKQTKSAKHVDDFIIATSTNSDDEPIVEYCKENNIKYFRGSEENVLDRYYQCAKKYNLDTIIRITSDCPLIDPNVIDLIFSKFENNSFDYVSNNIEKTQGKWFDSECNFPQGMTVEICKFHALEKAWNEAKKPSEYEHVFPYVQFHPELFKISNIVNSTNLSNIRCTVDRIDDLNFIKEIINRFSENKNFLNIEDIVKIVDQEPELLKINSHIPFDEGIKKSYSKDKKLGF